MAFFTKQRCSSIRELNFFALSFSMFFFSVSFIQCTPYKFAHLKIDSTELNQKLDQNASHFVLQGHVIDAENAKNPVGSVAYTYYKNSGKFSKDDLQRLDMKPVKFLGSFYLGNNFFYADSIRKYISDSAGNRVKYDYIMFIPFKTKSNYVAYKLMIVGNDILTSKGKNPIESEPCPPAICPNFN